MKLTQLLCLLFCTFSLYAQRPATPALSPQTSLSEQAEISVITCGPGEAVYEAFGHSAFRIRDPKTGLDKVYNYGTFDFSTPNFYGKFAQGKLLYLLGTGDFMRFLRSYQYQNRWVKAQVLDLSPKEVQACFNFLENNAQPENRAYLYDYFFDNCSTRLYDVVESVLGDQLDFPEEMIRTSSGTHRTLIQPYLTHQSWGDFGIDIALGSVIDREISLQEFLFLPDNVFAFFDQLKITKNGASKSIVKRTEVLLKETDQTTTDTFLSPFILFSVMGLLVMAVTRKNAQKALRSKWLDFSLFFTFGLMGLALALISFATNHASAANNFNLLWAFAPNLAISFILLKKEIPNWMQYYLLLLLILIGAVCVLWVFKVQIFSNAVLPVLVFLSIRYVYLYKLVRGKNE